MIKCCKVLAFVAMSCVIIVFTGCKTDFEKCAEGDAQACKVLKSALANASALEILKDSRDAQTYRTVKIGNQVWMAENLNVKTKDSWCYDDKESNCKKYGRLYTLDAAMKACPSGWHLPSYTEFETLINTVGGESKAGKKLKSTSGWNDSGNGSDAYSFSALPAGGRNSYGDYIHKGQVASFWSSTEDDYAYDLSLGYGYDGASLGGSHRGGGASVRCIKD